MPQGFYSDFSGDCEFGCSDLAKLFRQLGQRHPLYCSGIGLSGGKEKHQHFSSLFLVVAAQ